MATSVHFFPAVFKDQRRFTMDARLDDLIGGRPDVPFGGGRLVGACSVAALAKNARVS